MFDLINITKAMSDKSRLRIILALKETPMCVCQLTSLLDLAPSTTSKHINILHKAKLVESEKNGKWVFYKLVDSKKNKLIGDVLTLLENGSVDAKEISMDKKKIKKILNEYCDLHHEKHSNLLNLKKGK